MSPINWPKKKERKPEREDRDKPKKPLWRDRVAKVLIDMEHTRGTNHQNRREDAKVRHERVEAIRTTTGTRRYTSRLTKTPMGQRRSQRRMKNKIAHESRKVNRPIHKRSNAR